MAGYKHVHLQGWAVTRLSELSHAMWGIERGSRSSELHLAENDVTKWCC